MFVTYQNYSGVHEGVLHANSIQVSLFTCFSSVSLGFPSFKKVRKNYPNQYCAVLCI